ncbi:MAG: hypothetical protein JW894_15705 [Bacteroidales bacterium]|nr:hypothetical protein [Bacteroidales bacterium]
MKTRFNPHISVDCVVFGFDLNELKILLINRDSVEDVKPDKNKIKLPGSLIIRFEELHQSAHRVLQKYTGLDNIYLKQFGIFDSPGRLSDEEDVTWLKNQTNVEIQRVITVAYYSLIRLDDSKTTKLSESFNAKWYSATEVPDLMFDHNKILEEGIKTLRNELISQPIGFNLLPEKFTLNQLQQLYEVVLGVKMDNRNFRKRAISLKYIEPLNEWQKGLSNKPAKLHSFNRDEYEKFINKNTLFII